MAENSNISNQPNSSFLGRGWKFPVSFSGGSYTADLVEEEEDVRESLIILLSTSLGERIMRPEFGANMDDLLFESMSVTTLTMLTNRLKRAILLNESRVKVEKLDLIPKVLEGLIEVHILYTISSNNSRWNLVYPYYINEGTNVKQ